ncbi:MAG: Exodeoxyribonuclease 7 large subunit [Candidatus Curtissbacteria bacterium GW2011_GWA1_40_47]|uniref:Exodeoxyribonuclease 7 large subunit n=1 Tax=Candidatus Curtissbacteria bacterium RIFOXYA1_FULL_41_14 TaxID=1797737 RepID=A0A1F5HBL4_9BACT|nr:MAG: Exodeoxyribonuclease 7 large subunit [Candidatus Curtissbacteria bacterium GW2011_GWB1_40_28]KKR60963.1 MAG: Exodeoxyribonuclease 7 large subunit [Candidatus Curtissbacteria bacterium GW2011_GWA2_40_31]KKR61815.1 MAG: Exodeoxyribonuclease 7 large subunit [Microgenomates group bacterium GW2011_GWC1_40_35]KKR65867.1 MAG: Exodeoxyribonuclease 7 large subunit [Candidatus Curtissbacteria bacterium GW2011_GWA1_40_47]KKR77544.1 MAG: Exodeoxyribonuclease 7 large subunit [Candidatus Curtissbacte
MKNIAGKNVYTVSEVNSLARQTLEGLTFWVEGEISSFRGLNNHYRYLYFDLKDPGTGYKLPCILEPEIFTSLGFQLADGGKILALGNLTLWEKEAKFQMYLFKIEDFGEGYLLAQLEELKRKLESKGYFNLEIKKSLPAYPTNIAVISSKVSDAWQDFKKHTIDKFGVINVTFFDVMVQGQKCVTLLCQAIKKADPLNFDVIVLIRGGGSIEDLAAYNDEQVAETIYRAKTPILVGVGHEKDVTIAQLVADIAASTPTDAAKIISSDFLLLDEKLSSIAQKMALAVTNRLTGSAQQLDLLFQKLSYFVKRHREIPKALVHIRQSLSHLQKTIILGKKQRLLVLQSSLKSKWVFILQENSNSLNNLRTRLDLLSPQNILKRGYSIAYSPAGKIIKDADLIAIGSKLKVKLARGELSSKVLGKKI